MSEANESHATRNIIEPVSNDVMLGRGACTNNHPGNKHFRNVVKKHLGDYLAAKNNYEKYLTTMDILTNIRSLKPPGRFILQDKKTKLWNEVGDDKARRKINEALRENACDAKQSSDNSTLPALDSSKMTHNDDFKTSRPLESKNCFTLNTCQQSNDKLSNNSMELSRSELEDLLRGFISQATGQDSSNVDLGLSINTFPTNDMSLSFGNLSTLLQDFISQATGQDSSIIDLGSSIKTFPTDDMSLSSGNLSTLLQDFISHATVQDFH